MTYSTAAVLRLPRERRLPKVIDPFPSAIEPMLAVPSNLPANQSEYTFEYKWDGVRAICYSNGTHFHLESRNRLDITRRYPELQTLSKALGGQSAVLDGEIVSLDESTCPSFAKLQRRMHLNDPREIIRLSKSEPVFYVLFDLLYLDGRSIMSKPQQHRRERLEELTLAGAFWQVTPAHVGEGTSMLQAARDNQLEGLVAKKLDSPYEPGRRSPTWRKIKIIQRQELVIGGWISQRGGSGERIGSILMGYYDCDGKLRYAGKVGTGLSAGDHALLLKKLSRHSASKNPFADAVPSGAHFTQPNVVAEIEYRRWPANGLIQHAAFKGIRTDKSARQVIKEAPAR